MHVVLLKWYIVICDYFRALVHFSRRESKSKCQRQSAVRLLPVLRAHRRVALEAHLSLTAMHASFACTCSCSYSFLFHFPAQI